MSKTHLAFGLLVGLFVSEFFGVENKLLFVSIVVFSSLLPDLDIPASKIGQKVRPLSWLLNIFFGHRGLMHTVYIPLLVWFIFISYGKAFIAGAFFLGYMSHLIIDMLNVKGIYFFYPLIRVRLNGFIKANGFLERLLFFAILVGIVLLLVV
jgi:inner membrane protein